MNPNKANILVTAYHGQTYWNLPAEGRAFLESTFPEVVWSFAESPDPEGLSELSEAQVLFGWYLSPAAFARAPRLRWIHSPATGVKRLLYPELVTSPVVLTSSRGVHAPFLAEQVMAWILAHSRRLYRFHRGQAERSWVQESVLGEEPPETLMGKTALLVGYGSTGRELARRLAAFGVAVRGVRRRPRPRGVGAVDVYGPESVDDLLPHADIVVNLLPSTGETRGFFDRSRLERMKPDGFFANVGRGATVDESALAELLLAGRLSGVGLDVFATEPLPEESPLWMAPGAQLSPHLAGVGHPLLWSRLVELFVENLRAFLEDRPLKNQVDKQAGY